jgi:hypothetical protein
MTWTGVLLGFLAVVVFARWLLIGGDEARAVGSARYREEHNRAMLTAGSQTLR